MLCDSFNIPLVFLTDTPGFLIGVAGERQKAPGKIMNFMTAMQMCTVPKLSLVMRKSYGQAYLNMAGTRNADEMIAWPMADVGFMDPGVAVNVVYGVTREAEPERFEQLLSAVEGETTAYEPGQHLLGPVRHRAAPEPRPPATPARCPRPPAHRRHRRAPAGHLADDVLRARLTPPGVKWRGGPRRGGCGPCASVPFT